MNRLLGTLLVLGSPASLGCLVGEMFLQGLFWLQRGLFEKKVLGRQEKGRPEVRMNLNFE